MTLTNTNQEGAMIIVKSERFKSYIHNSTSLHPNSNLSPYICHKYIIYLFFFAKNDNWYAFINHQNGCLHHWPVRGPAKLEGTPFTNTRTPSRIQFYIHHGTYSLSPDIFSHEIQIYIKMVL